MERWLAGTGTGTLAEKKQQQKEMVSRYRVYRLPFTVYCERLVRSNTRPGLLPTATTATATATTTATTFEARGEGGDRQAGKQAGRQAGWLAGWQRKAERAIVWKKKETAAFRRVPRQPVVVVVSCVGRSEAVR